MSIYDYRCIECRRVEEQEHGMNESPSFLCSLCGNPMEKVILSPPNIDKFFPGSTWEEVRNRPTSRTDW